MSKLDEVRESGYEISLISGDEIDIDFPPGQERTQNLVDRLMQLKPILVQELKDERISMGGLYRYHGYSTRKDKHGKGRLVLELVSNDTGELIVCYFNVNIAYQRGPNKGKYFKTGRNGRFWVYPGSNFALFWLETFGKTDKWSRLYRQLNRLKAIQFSGTIKISSTYQQITDLTAVKIS